MKNRNRYLIIVLITLLAAILSSCGCKEYIGTWYNIDDPDSSSLTITKDNTYSWNSEGGSVSETDEGILLIEQSGLGGTMQFSISKFDGDTALVKSNGDTYIKDYEKAVEYHSEQIANKIENQSNMLIGHWAEDYFDLILYEDGTYELSCYDILYNTGAPETGSWEATQRGDYLDVFLTKTNGEESRLGDKIIMLDDGRLMPHNAITVKLERQ